MLAPARISLAAASQRISQAAITGSRSIAIPATNTAASGGKATPSPASGASAEMSTSVTSAAPSLAGNAGKLAQALAGADSKYVRNREGRVVLRSRQFHDSPSWSVPSANASNGQAMTSDNTPAMATTRAAAAAAAAAVKSLWSQQGSESATPRFNAAKDATAKFVEKAGAQAREAQPSGWIASAAQFGFTSSSNAASHQHNGDGMAERARRKAAAAAIQVRNAMEGL